MEFPSFMAILPTWEVAVTFVGISVSLVVASTFALRRTIWYRQLADSTTFISVMYPMVGAIFGVVLAFTIVLSWQRFSQAEMHTASEVTLLSSLWRNSQAFECKDRIDIEKRLIAYARNVVAREWNSLAVEGKQDPDTTRSYEEIWRFYRAYVPSSSYTERQFYESALQQLDEFGIQRRHRLLSATSEISGIVWIFLCVGGLATVCIPMIVWTKLETVQVSVNGLMAFIVAFSLWIVASLQYPYSGDVSVSKAPFETLIESFERRQRGDCEISDQN